MKASEKMLLLLQRLVPARTMGNLFYVLSRSRVVWFKNAFIRVFARLYRVDVSEAAGAVPDDYACFNDFFTRELRPGSRPLCPEPEMACPADGTVAAAGFASHGRLLQAKEVDFSVAGLLADPELAKSLADAPFVTVYLAPYNYHRVHMPLQGRLVSTRFIPGKLYSVNARTTATLPGLYALNERLVCHFIGDSGPFAVVLVGAMNVASMTTAWGGEELTPADGKIRVTHFNETDNAPVLARGDYLGHFNMGSTVVVLGPPRSMAWAPTVATGSIVRVGQSLGRPA